jgi:hypothetical protein
MYRGLLLAGWFATALCATAVLADPPAPPPDTAAAADDANAPLAADADIYVYPTKGQSDKQLDRDRYECHNWAVKQSHFNPSEPHLAPHQQIQVVAMPPPGRDTAAGAITGAVIGAAVAGPRDAGRGAVVGAVAGAVIGATSESARQKEAAGANNRVSAEAQAERARIERQASDYRRAISACLEGRGYTVK